MSRPARAGYDAFISYSHAGDAAVAAILQRSLHGFARPWYRLRALRVFRDTASLSANPSLWTAIERALASTRFFILVASPEAAQSEWVAKEVGWWCQHKSKEQLLIVLSDGVLAWNEAGADFDWNKTTALPRVLEGVFTEEPLYVDLGFARGARQLSPRHPELREAVATLAATIHDRPRDDLIGEDVRRHRRTIQVATFGVATIASLAVVASWQWVVATDQRNRAREQAAIALSRQLAAQADAAVRDGRLDVGLLLGVTASVSHDTVEARDVLLTGLQSSPELVALLDSPDASAVAHSPDDRTLAIGHEDGSIELWDLVGHRRRGDPWQVHGDRVTTLAFSPEGKLLASGGADSRIVISSLDSGGHHEFVLTSTIAGVFFDSHGRALVAGDRNGRVGRWDVRTARSTGEMTCAGGLDVTTLTPAPQGNAVAVGTAEGYVVLCDLRTGERLWRSARLAGGVHSLAFDGRALLAAGSENGSIVLWNRRHRRLGSLQGNQAIVSALAFGRNGGLASAGLDGAVVLWPAARRRGVRRDPRAARTLRASGSRVLDLAFSTSGLLTSVGPDGATLWDIQRRERIGADLPATPQTGALTALAFAGTTLASGDNRGDVWVRDVQSRKTRRVLHLSPVAALAFSGDGRTLAAGGVDGTVKIWNATQGRVTTLSTPQNESVMGLALQADGRSVIGGDRRGRLLAWNLTTRRRATLATWDAGIQSMAVNSVGNALAVADGQGNIVLARLQSDSARFSVLGRHEGATQVGYVPDGSFVASASSDGSIRLWDTSRPGMSVRLRAGARDAVTGLAFSSDSRLLAAAAGSEVKLWDIRTKEPLGLPLSRPGTQLITVAFGAGGTLVTGGWQGSAWAWTTDLDTWRTLACATVNRTLSEAEWSDFVGPPFAYDPPCSR